MEVVNIAIVDKKKEKNRWCEGVRSLTSCLATAYSSVAGIGQVTTNIADFGINEALAGEVLAVEMLGSPETAGGDGAELGSLGDGSGG